MKELIPACPECKTAKYVVRVRTAEKIGTAAGGLIGAMGVAYLEYQSKVEAGAIIGSLVGTLVMPVVGTKAGAQVGAATGAVLGFLSGSATGYAVGEVIDSKIRIKYRCCNCGTEIQG